MTPTTERGSLAEIAAAFLRLGCTSFGGPVAHLGYFREEFVVRRRWLDDAAYGDLVALCQFLPGPASSQVVFALGMRRRGLAGALLASACFTLPSALLMLGFAAGVAVAGDLGGAGWLHGLKLAAAAVVALAVWGMARALCPDLPRATLAAATCVSVFVIQGAAGQMGALAFGGVAGWALDLAARRRGAASEGKGCGDDGCAPEAGTTGGAGAPPDGNTRPVEEAAVRREEEIGIGTGRHLAAAATLALAGLLLFVLPMLAAAWEARELRLFDAFYRAGALVFGGGHVILPMLRAEVVPTGLLSDDAFLAGYGAAQALPGPLFTFSAYLGATIGGGSGPVAWMTGAVCLCGIFLPAMLLVGGALPYWQLLRRRAWMQAVLRGTNAAVVGVLLAAFIDPVLSDSVHTLADGAVAVVAFALLASRRAPPWLVVLLAAAAGQALG